MPERNSTKLVRTAVYYRMSSDHQEHSIERQREQVEPYALANGYEIVREYKDEGISGWKEGDRRPEFARLLKDGLRGLFDAILCDELSRFSRLDSIDFGYVVKPLRDAGVRLVTVDKGELDLRSFSGRVVSGVDADYRHSHSVNTSRLVLTKLIQMARQGVWFSGPPPYGYTKDPTSAPTPLTPGETRRLTPGDPEQVKVIQWIFTTYAEKDVSIRWLSHELHKRGVRSPKGAERWGPMTLAKILANKVYIGVYRWNHRTQGEFYEVTGGGVKEKRRKGEQRTNEAAEWIVVPDAHPPLVTQEVFEAVQARLAGNRNRKTPTTAAGNWLLSGLLHCAHCGCRMLGTQTRTRRREARYYLCGGYSALGKRVCNHHTIEEVKLIACIARVIQQEFLNPARLDALEAELRAQVEEERREDPSEVRRLRTKMADLDAKIRQGGERLAVMPPDLLPDLMAAIRGWRTERERTTADLAALERRPDLPSMEAEIAAAKSHLWRLREGLSAADPVEVRTVLRELISKVELTWEHAERGPHVISKFARGVIYLRQEQNDDCSVHHEPA